MPVPFPHIYDIAFYVSGNNKERVLVASDIESLPLAYCVELCAFVASYYLAVRVILIPCFLYVLLSIPVRVLLNFVIL